MWNGPRMVTKYWEMFEHNLKELKHLTILFQDYIMKLKLNLPNYKKQPTFNILTYGENNDSDPS